MGRSLSASELRATLITAGQEVLEENGDAIDVVHVSPSRDIIVTVSLNLDPTLKPKYRERYFACFLESEQNPVPVIRFDPSFAFPEEFRSVAEQSPPANEFVDGPFRWLLHRLLRFSEVLFWPTSTDFAMVLDLSQRDDCKVLWEAANGDYGPLDCYVSDPECREVYRLHHHDKVVPSIPDKSAREEMLQELAARNDLFEDCSGYGSEMDEVAE
jgi:hypothetical protein